MMDLRPNGDRDLLDAADDRIAELEKENKEYLRAIIALVRQSGGDVHLLAGPLMDNLDGYVLSITEAVTPFAFRLKVHKAGDLVTSPLDGAVAEALANAAR